MHASAPPSKTPGCSRDRHSFPSREAASLQDGADAGRIRLLHPRLQAPSKQRFSRLAGSRRNAASGSVEDRPVNDRELLEMAANAAGIDHISVHADGMVYAHDDICSNPTLWNPLTDDADALRLAVKLNMSVSTGPLQVQANTISGALRGAFFKESRIDMDPCAATRLVIVRAAAEVGKEQQ
jgi:hypothetical protein